MLGFNLSEYIPNFTNHDISERIMRCGIFIRELWHYMSKTIELLKELHFLVRFLNKPDKRRREEIFGVRKIFVRKLMDYFFILIDLETTSFGN